MLSAWTGLLALLVSAGEPIVDDFAAGDWARFDSTPGTLTQAAGRLTLVDSPEEPEWITASKIFRVDCARTRWILIEVAELSDRGTVKLIRREPYDKREVLAIDRPGLYGVDLTGELGWTGPAEIEVCLYAIGDRESITYASVRFVAAPSDDQRHRIAERSRGGNPRLVTAPFELAPLFGSCSYYFTSPERPGLRAEFRRAGEPWQPAYPPVWVPEDGMYRGSVVRLAEDTAHELRVVDAGGATLAQGEFRTWASQVPIGRTIVLDAASFPGRLRINDGGTADGWLKITARDGFVLRNDRTGPLLELDGARYVVLEGLTLRGGLEEAISIRRCQQVRVINCDIAGWGRVGTQRFDLDGKFYTPEGAAINWDSAILVSRSLGTVIERCWIHDPVSRANSWSESHPAGPQAVGIDKPRSTVLRWNDFIGSDEHRWNDAVEGSGNFEVDGGFHRDADIHGNLMCLANDDALEIDGGQTNVRVFGNRFEACLCGVSIQGCMSGPSYVFGNLIANLGDERRLAGQSIKTSSSANGASAVSFLFHNTTFGDSSDLRLLANLRVVARNNLFGGRVAVSGRGDSPQSDCDYNLCANGPAGAEPHGLSGVPGLLDPVAGRYALGARSPAVGAGQPVVNFGAGHGEPPDLGALPRGAERILPERPIPMRVDREQLVFEPDSPPRTVTLAADGTGFVADWTIARNDAFAWFSVTPSAGRIASGETVTLTVTPHPERMTARAVYRGAFLIRLASGFSRPVMIAARTRYVPPMKPAREGAWIAYLEAEEAAGGPFDRRDDPAASGGRCLALSGPPDVAPAELRFRTPRSGVYFVALRIRSPEPVGAHDSVRFAIDDGPLERAQLRSSTAWTWCLAAHNRAMSLICLQPLTLAAGEHVLKVAPEEALEWDLAAVTDEASLF